MTAYHFEIVQGQWEVQHLLHTAHTGLSAMLLAFSGIDLSADEAIPIAAVRLTPRHTAYLRVAEGCNHACTFCAIPGFRGKFRSKSWEAVLEEARRLVQAGVVELNLIAEDTNQYGQDRWAGPQGKHGACTRGGRRSRAVLPVRVHMCY